MKVLVDTPIWSLAFRRKIEKHNPEERLLVEEITELIFDTRAVLLGPVRQEVLSGISVKSQFDKLKNRLNAFEDIKIDTGDYELAAEFYNRCRKGGIQGSHIDFLLCAVAKRNGIPVFTTDKDFALYSKYTGITLHTLGLHH